MVEADLTMVEKMVTEEIRRLVADAIEAERCLAVAHCAERIGRAYPNCGRTLDELADEIIRAAISARVAVEMGRPQPAGTSAAV